MSTTNITKTHVHAEVIKAWADGEEVEVFDGHKDWVNVKEFFKNIESPAWYDDLLFRIKPEPKPDRIEIRKLSYNPKINYFEIFEEKHNLEYYSGTARFTFDGETEKLKSVEIL